MTLPQYGLCCACEHPRDRHELVDEWDAYLASGRIGWDPEPHTQRCNHPDCWPRCSWYERPNAESGPVIEA